MNVFHCCIYKTASQWVKSIFSDPRISEFSKLRPYDYERDAFFKIGPQRLNKKLFPEPLQDGTFITPLYISYPAFKEVEKGSSYKAFFVTRDPRDIVVSWYFSMKYSHAVIADYIARDREYFRSIPEKEGLREAIHRVSKAGFFDALDSWIDAPGEDDNVTLVKYEDLTGKNGLKSFARLLEHCEIGIPEDTLKSVLEDYSFEKLTGRERGLEDENSHFRKGIEGDWVNFFDDELLEDFQKIAGDLPRRLGYKSRDELTQQSLHFYQNLSSEIYLDLCTVKTELVSTKSELVSTKSELSSVKSELSLQKACFEKASQDLSQAQEELISSRTVIKRKSSAVNKLKARISDQEKDLREARRNLRILENRIKQMENSKFWKLRNLWSNLKHLKLTQ